MIAYRMALTKATLEAGKPLRLGACWRAWWVEAGEIRVGGHRLAARSGRFTREAVAVEQAGAGAATVLRFELMPAELTADPQALLVETVEFEPAETLLRLDTVNFPPGATAYRHVHAGSGIRYLFDGSLEITTEHGRETMVPGMAWFEPANSPVVAQAAPDTPSAFVRAMVIPKAYAGVSTFKLCDPADAGRPRRQVTDRYFDAPLS